MITKQEYTDKHHMILETAIRRFAHFGANKTTMTEIAEDLNLTKQALSHYYPDKLSLLEAVQDKIVNEYFGALRDAVNCESKMESILMQLPGIKQTFFQKYLLLLTQQESLDSNAGSAYVSEVRNRAKQREVDVIAGLFEKGILMNEFRDFNTKQVSALLVDIMRAFEYGVFHRRGVLEAKSVDDLAFKQKEVLQLIVNGLKNRQWEN